MARPMPILASNLASAGKKVLILDGGVDDHAAAWVDAALRTYGPVDEVWLNSPGGNAHQGTAIGQALRRWGVSAYIPAGFWCISACNFAFVGAPSVRSTPGAVRGSYLHRRPLQVVRSYREFFSSPHSSLANRVQPCWRSNKRTS